MVYCRSTQLREKSMASYEQALRLFERWCAEELRIFTVDKVTEPVIRKYINDLQERGKYKKTHHNIFTKWWDLSIVIQMYKPDAIVTSPQTRRCLPESNLL